MSVITISRQLGAYGERIGHGLARALGWRYLDRHSIHRAAIAAGIPEMALATLAYEGRRSFLERLVSALNLDSAVPALPDQGDFEPFTNPVRLAPMLPPVANTTQDYINVVNDLVRLMADEGEAVIVGRAAQVTLGGRPDTFHVRMIAPFELRVARLRARHGEPRATVVSQLRASDEARTEYLRRYYAADWQDPLLYDLVLNTAHLSTEATIKMIALGWKAKCQPTRPLPPPAHQPDWPPLEAEGNQG